jgi:hypothetical protein
MISIFVSVPRSVIGLSASNSACERMMRVEHRCGKPRERDEERESPESCHGGRASKTKAIGDERLKERKSRLRDASTNNPVDPAHAMRTELFVT